MLIGVVGFIGSGKGTVGDILTEHGFHKDSFAKPLKDAVAMIFGWSRELLEGDTDRSRTWREEIDPYWSEKFNRPFTPREALQLMGTEAGRDVFHNDIWVISLLNRVKGKDVVVTDVRFQNEIKYIQDNGGIVIRVKRGDDPKWVNDLEQEKDGQFFREQFMKGRGVHISEWDWVGCDFDFTIHNEGTVDDLRQSVKSILQFIQ
jgi:hypothetical protein